MPCSADGTTYGSAGIIPEVSEMGPPPACKHYMAYVPCLLTRILPTNVCRSNSNLFCLASVHFVPVKKIGTDQAGVTILSKLLTICVDIAIGIAIVIEIETK